MSRPMRQAAVELMDHKLIELAHARLSGVEKAQVVQGILS